MKRNGLTVMMLALPLILSSCAPVLNKTYMREGQREPSFEELRKTPAHYRGQLFVLGGIIVKTKFTGKGSELEAVDVPVDRYGYFQERGRSEGRFLAILTGDNKMLDPIVYGRGRRVTLAGEFIETKNGKIDDMEYDYPVFEIKQIYLWPKEREYDPMLFYDDPWFYPYPYYYGDPWWRYYHYTEPESSPGNRRMLPPNLQRRERESEHERHDEHQ
jgi:outer membrane lipoprotein